MIIIKSKTKTVAVNEHEIMHVNFDKIAHTATIYISDKPSREVENVESVTYVENGQVLNVDEHPIEVPDWTMKMERLKAEKWLALDMSRAYLPLYQLMEIISEQLSDMARICKDDNLIPGITEMKNGIQVQLKQAEAALEKAHKEYNERIEKLNAE